MLGGLVSTQLRAPETIVGRFDKSSELDRVLASPARRRSDCSAYEELARSLSAITISINVKCRCEE